MVLGAPGKGWSTPRLRTAGLWHNKKDSFQMALMYAFLFTASWAWNAMSRRLSEDKKCYKQSPGFCRSLGIKLSEWPRQDFLIPKEAARLGDLSEHDVRLWLEQDVRLRLERMDGKASEAGTVHENQLYHANVSSSVNPTGPGCMHEKGGPPKGWAPTARMARVGSVSHHAFRGWSPFCESSLMHTH